MISVLLMVLISSGQYSIVRRPVACTHTVYWPQQHWSVLYGTDDC